MMRMCCYRVDRMIACRRRMRRQTSLRRSRIRNFWSPRSGVVVRVPGDDRRLVEILFRRRRGRRPLQTDRAPRIRPGLAAELQRVDQIDKRQQLADAEIDAPAVDRTFSTWNSGAIRVIAARHAQIAEDELREERQIEADEHHAAPRAAPTISGYIRPVIFGHQ